MDRGEPIRVAVVDDHGVFAESLAVALDTHADLTVVGVAGSIADGLELVARTAPDVVLMDVRLPDGVGTDAVQHLRAAADPPAVLVVTASDGPEILARAVEAGAAGLLSKGEPLRTVVAAVRHVHHGAVLFDAATLARVAAHLRQRDRLPGADLTAREREVLQLVATGASTDSIAATLVLSPHTVRNHVRNLLTKLHARSKLEGVAVALRHGLIDVENL